LGRIAAQAQPRLLVLTHQLLWMGATQEDLLEEIRRSFEGPIAFGRDLDVF
jgi:ribonuclease BN (tRNA processing enzyme)